MYRNVLTYTHFTTIRISNILFKLIRSDLSTIIRHIRTLELESYSNHFELVRLFVDIDNRTMKCSN